MAAVMDQWTTSTEPGRPCLVVPHEAAVEHQGAERLLHHQTLRFRGEPSCPGLPLDDLHVDAQTRTVLDHGLLEPGIHPALVHRWRGGGDLVQEGDPDRVVVHARGGHDHRDDQAEDVGGDALLAARALLSRIQPGSRLRCVPEARTVCESRTAAVGSSCRLRISRVGRRSRSWMDSAVPSSRRGRKVVHSALRRQAMGQVASLAAGPALVEDRVHDLPYCPGILMAAHRTVAVLPRRDHRLDQRALPIR